MLEWHLKSTEWYMSVKLYSHREILRLKSQQFIGVCLRSFTDCYLPSHQAYTAAYDRWQQQGVGRFFDEKCDKRRLIVSDHVQLFLRLDTLVYYQLLHVTINLRQITINYYE